jgi:hypothetical protein
MPTTVAAAIAAVVVGTIVSEAPVLSPLSVTAATESELRKVIFLWDLTLCSLLKQCSACYLLGLFFDHEYGGNNCPLKYQPIFNGLHGIMSQKTTLHNHQCGGTSDHR